jgi:DNA-binding beta-propeller fold protein YncE
MMRKQVVVFDADDNYLRVYGNQELLDKPVDVAVYENSVYICDMNKHQVLVLDKDTGTLQKTIGKQGGEEGQFNKPSHISLDDAGNIYVNDAFNYRIQKFDRNGEFIKSFGFHGDIVGAFARPKGLDVDRDGHMYVVDSAYENTQIFDAESGRLLLFFGGSGETPGSMYLPASIHIDYSNAEYFTNFADKDFNIEYVVYVGNMFGSRKLNVYGFGQWTGEQLSGGAEEIGEQKNRSDKPQ